MLKEVECEGQTSCSTGKFAGKKLLVLGTNTGSVEIVNYAHENGAYVIVADYLPPEQSAAKQIADESVLINTADVEALCDYGRRKKIDGVFSGVSEFNLSSVQKVASVLSLPCYFTERQWNLVANKENFRKLCVEAGMPTPKTYDIPLGNDFQHVIFPVICKPVDQAAGVGIKICHNEWELRAAYAMARDCSSSGNVIVEEYVQGDEFSMVYNVADGEVALSCTYDRLLNRRVLGVLPICQASVFPSKHSETLVNQCDAGMRRLIELLQLRNGTLFLQGIIRGGKCYVFEAGLRLSGGATYRFVEKYNGVNVLHSLVDYALLGRMNHIIKREDATFGGRFCALIGVLVNTGSVAEIVGMDQMRESAGDFDLISSIAPGSVIPAAVPVKHNPIRVYAYGHSLQEVFDIGKRANALIDVLDAKGRSLRVPHSLDEYFMEDKDEVSSP